MTATGKRRQPAPLRVGEQPQLRAPPRRIQPLSAAQARKWHAELDRRLRDTDDIATTRFLRDHPGLAEFAVAVMTLSPFLRDIMLSEPSDLREALSRSFDEGLAEIGQQAALAGLACESDAELMTRLRLARRRAALRIALADLGGWWAGSRITAALSDFADACVGATTRHLLRDFDGGGKFSAPEAGAPEIGSGLIVLAMGKYGARELNYSSDIDLILFFDREAPALRTDDPVSLYTRFAKSLIRILQERTGDGYVFRVDLRLRPDPGATPLAVPTDLALNYYEAYGQNWERAALIKSRPVAGDIPVAETFLRELAPFIWRRHLDYAAIADIHSIKRQIHAHRGHGEIAVAGHNVKVGRGGIREIEFFAQTQQLIAGGRMPQLRQRGTIEALHALSENGWISAGDRDRMADAYWYLRAVEHRIQMVSDEQSHELPTDSQGLRRIALMMGENSANAFAARLTHVLRTVESTYGRLFETSPALTGQGGNLVFTGGDDDPATVETLSRMGFAQPREVIKIVRGWHYGHFASVRSAQAREMLTELAPALLEAIAGSGDADATLYAFDRFVAGLPAGIQLFSLLHSNAGLLRLLILILGAAPRLAAIITYRPHVFDGLLDPSVSAGAPVAAEFRERLDAALSRARDYEAVLDAARVFAAEQKFLIGVRLINRTVDGRRAGYAFSDLADSLIAAMLEEVRREFARRHGEIAGVQLCVLGMGRLGSRELNAGSDLDLILLYDHDPDAEQSDGRKPLPASLYFLRLAQRLIAAMSAPTGEGVIYPLDFRLRPSGNAGPLATHIDAFAKYQAGEAWTWERQALTRARVTAGDPQIAVRVEREIAEAIARPVEPETLRQDICEMRAMIDREKPTDNPFEVKTVPGGLTDIEFIGQWAVLATHQRPAGANRGSVAAMLSLLPEKTLGAAKRETLLRAHERCSELLHILRLCTDEKVEPKTVSPGLQRMICRALDLPDLATAVAQLKNDQKAVRTIFERLLGKLPHAKGEGKRPAAGLHRG